MKTPMKPRSIRSAQALPARLALLSGLLLSAAPLAQAQEAPVDGPEPERGADTQGPQPFGVQLSAGAGLGQRDVWLPTQLGVRKLDTGMFPALDVLLAADGGLGARGLLGARFHYQTSVGSEAVETPAGGVEKRSTLRANRVEAGLTPGLRFGDSERSVSLRFFAGWSFRGLRSVVDMSIPNYTLHGPVLRPELRIPLAHGVLELRLAPEAQLIAGVTSEFRKAGATAGTGVAYAAELSVSARLSRVLLASLSYREAHALLSTPWSDKVSDVERFITAGAVLCY